MHRLGAALVLLAMFGSCTRYVMHGVRFDRDDLTANSEARIEVQADVGKRKPCRLEAIPSIDVRSTSGMNEDEADQFRLTANQHSGEWRTIPRDPGLLPDSDLVVSQQVEHVSDQLARLGVNVEAGAKFALEIQFGTRAFDLASVMEDPEFSNFFMHYYNMILTDARGRRLWIGSAFSNRITRRSPAKDDDEVFALMQRMVDELLARICETDHASIPL